MKINVYSNYKDMFFEFERNKYEMDETENIVIVPTTIPVIIDSNNTKAILVGYSHFKRNNDNFSFYIYFSTIEKRTISRPINTSANMPNWRKII